MPDFVLLPLLARAPVTYMPARGRAPKTAIVEFTVDVLAPNLAGSDAPVVMAHKEPRVPTLCRLFDGQAWMTEAYTERPPELVRDWLGRDTNYRTEVLGEADAIPEGVPKGAVPAGAQVLDDGRPAAEARLREAAKRIAFIDGQCWLAGPVPGLSILSHRDGHARVEIRRARPGDERCYAFALDRQAELRAFVAANVFPGGFKAVPRPLEFELDPGVSWYYPEPRVNARLAVREALAALSHGLVDHPPAILGHLAALATLRDALAPDSWQPHLAGAADAELAAMEETRLGLKGLHTLGHAIRIGRDAIARSAHLHAADIESLAALA